MHLVSALEKAESPQMQVLNLPSSHFQPFAAVGGGGAMVGLVQTSTSTLMRNTAAARKVEVVGSRMQSVSGFRERWNLARVRRCDLC